MIILIKYPREAAVSGEDGRKVVELFTAIYRSTLDNAPVKFPLKHEPGPDGRQKSTEHPAPSNN